ncbi:MAG: type and secretion system protein [Schlesneria sp.]|nr:type and secretion system protein [Schlesneria sp.]
MRCIVGFAGLLMSMAPIEAQCQTSPTQRDGPLRERRSTVNLFAPTQLPLPSPLRIAQGGRATVAQVPPLPVPPAPALESDDDGDGLSTNRGLQPRPTPPGGLGRVQDLDPTRQREFAKFVDRTIDVDNHLDLVQGQPRLLVTKQAPLRYQIADDSIATVEVITEKELSIGGREVGTTVLNLWFEDAASPEGRTVLSYLVRVYPDSAARVRMESIYKALEDEINQAFPNCVVSLNLVGNQLILRGEAKDVQDATQILRIASANSPRGRGGNARVSQPEQVNLQISEPGALGAPPAEQLQLAGERVSEYLMAVNNAQQQGVVNLLRVPGEQQVMLRVTVAEVNRSAARNIGINFQILNSQGSAVFSQLTGGLIQAQTSAAGIISGNLPAVLDNGRIPIAINALRTLGLARSLAEPNLVAINGQTARFHAGGSFPVPVVTGATAVGLQGVAYVPFGVQLLFTPVVTDKSRIRLQVNASVSTRDPSIGTTIGGGSGGGGTTVSGLQSRNFTTTVELREGQTLAVAGLIQNNYGANSNRVPFAGDLPFVGRFFSNDGASAQEQELIVLVTPELVHPLDPNACPVLPGSDIYEPDDVEFFLLGRLESRRSEDFRSAARTDCDRLKTYRRCQQKYIIGPSGHCDGRY